MTNIDQFESIFRAAAKEKFEQEDVAVDRVLIVTDQPESPSLEFVEHVKQFLRVFSVEYHADWDQLYGDQFDSVERLVKLIDEKKPDLICTYRNLHTAADPFPYSLGVYVDVLTQATSVPILLMPRPGQTKAGGGTSQESTGTAKVMAITDHLAGDHHLVNVAAKLVQSGGTLLLTHVEDQYYFDRFLSVIGKIPEIDSEIAKESIMKRLLDEPSDYIESAKAVIEESENVKVESIVTVGHLMKDHLRIIEENDVDLLIMHTKDDDQLAMHGLAYPIAVEVRHLPILMI